MRQARLIFFDIDGTLTRSQNGYIPFNEAILETFGFPGDIRTVVPDGNTDPLIVEEIFARAHHDVEITEGQWENFARNLEESYSRAIREGHTRVSPLPGVLDFVRGLLAAGGFCLGVVSGNLEVVARIKLESAGLALYLATAGAYGSDSRHRTDLPRIARERWEKRLGRSIAPQQCVIVGDTPKDLAAARTNRMKCLLVGTGRYPLEELTGCRPDGCLPDFTATRESVETLVKLF